MFFTVALIAVGLIIVYLGSTQGEAKYAANPLLTAKNSSPAPIEEAQNKSVSKISAEKVNGSAAKEPKFVALSWKSRPQHRLNGKLSDHIKALRQKIGEGDQHAKYILAVNLATCHRAAVTKDDLEAELKYWKEDGQRQSMLDSKARRFHFCEGISIQDRAMHMTYYLQLVESGFTPALENIGTMQDKIYMQNTKQMQLKRDEYVTAVSTFREAKYQYMSQAAMQGSMQALSRLSHTNSHDPKIFGFDKDKGRSSLSLALANAKTLLYFTEDNLVYSRAQFLINKHTEQASAQELSYSVDLSMQMIEKIKQHGQAYPVIKRVTY